MIRFTLNGETRDGRDELALVELIAELDLAHKRLAVEINEDVIPKARYQDVRINDGDRIEIVSFVGGG